MSLYERFESVNVVLYPIRSNEFVEFTCVLFKIRAPEPIKLPA